MAISAFDAHDELWFHALVFAPNSWEASEIAELHRDMGFGVGCAPVTILPRLMPLAGPARDQLQAALDRGKTGIGHLQASGGWMIHPPGERPPYSISPTRMEMHAFDDDDGDEYVIFARDRKRAEEIYIAYLECASLLPQGWIPLTSPHA